MGADTTAPRLPPFHEWAFYTLNTVTNDPAHGEVDFRLVTGLLGQIACEYDANLVLGAYEEAYLSLGGDRSLRFTKEYRDTIYRVKRGLALQVRTSSLKAAHGTG